jgi:hypothetical protein
MRKLTALVIILAALATSGCAAAAVGYMAYKLSESRTESAQKLQRSMDLRTYAQYRVAMERLNLDREKAGLKANPVMTQEDWIAAQTAGRPAIAPPPETAK